MTRRSVYGVGLLLLLASAALTLTSIALPRWISYSSATIPTFPPTSPPSGSDDDAVRVTYGLHSRCSSLSHPACRPFPTARDCSGDEGERVFCSLWRSLGFLMNFSVVILLACFVGFVVTLLGGREKREGGWKMVSGLCAVTAVVQIAAMSIVAYLHDHDPRFEIGWSLDASTVLCTISWVVLGITSAGTIAAVYVLPPEDDYEPIP